MTEPPSSGPRRRLMVPLGAFASLRPEEVAALRRRLVDLAACSPHVTGGPRTRAGSAPSTCPTSRTSAGSLRASTRRYVPNSVKLRHPGRAATVS
ncbi:hypothetical protein ACGFY9_01960 [Streptomyces sp. NPDC048504]|uniref:hypothetical protein n=1 Tax=Streptomyces sp. NPDC048504 TaxID=3365559 RepID=UPI003719E6D9